MIINNFNISSITYAGVGFHASTQPTFILYLIPPTYLVIIKLKIDFASDPP